MSRAKKAPAKLAEVPKAGPVSTPGAELAPPPEPVYVDVPRDLQLVIANAELQIAAETKTLEATKARADLAVSEIADALGYRISQVQFERMNGPNGVEIKLRIK